MAAFGVDIGTTLGVMGFDPGLKEIFGSDSDSIALRVLGNAQADFDISETMNLTLSVEHDPILMTRVMPLLGFSYNLISLKVGPFMGFSDIQVVDVNPGISMALDITASGIVFGSLRFDTSMGGGSIVPKEFAQEMWEVKAGFWTPYIIFSIGAQNRSFTEQQDAGIYSKEWTRYVFSMDIYQKNNPRTFRIDMGLQKLKWMTYKQPEQLFDYNSFFLGAEFQWQINYLFKIIIGIEGSVYSWDAQKSIDAQVPSMVLVKANLGTVWTIGK
jgi:hypothetical protein